MLLYCKEDFLTPSLFLGSRLGILDFLVAGAGSWVMGQGLGGVLSDDRYGIRKDLLPGKLRLE